MRAAAVLRPVGQADQLSVVDHLDELRTRLIVSLLAIAVAFGLCFWQNHRLLRLINAPLAHQTQQQVREGHGPLGATYAASRGTRDVAVQLQAVVGLLAAERRQPAISRALRQIDANLGRDVARLSTPPPGDRPVTLGIGEPFTTTVTVSLIFALILALPVVLGQVYAFLMPAFDPSLRRRMRPVLLAIPILLTAGVGFGYFVVLPAALHFFQNFNSTQFNVLVQASQYYKFAATILLAMGLLFQIPVVIIGITRAEVITPAQLRRNRRYALAACALLAAVLPGDLITMLLEIAPVYLLFEGSVLIAAVAARRRGDRVSDTSATSVAAG
jgi:sec-independent protein translocase protein TatC